MSIPSPPPKPSRVVRSFMCHDDLWRAFAERAATLECSVDWLLGEAMKRMLESGPQPAPRTMPSLPPTRPPVLAPPPRQRKSSSSFVGPRPLALVATSSDPSHRDEVLRMVIDRDRFVIGRSPKNTSMVLRDPAVSRQHAIIERTGEGFVVVDMASRNGVLLNGTRVTRAVLRPGDVIAIGPFSIAVERT